MLFIIIIIIIINPDVSVLGGVYVPCIYRMPGGISQATDSIGSLLLWACVQCVTSIVRAGGAHLPLIVVGY